MKIALLQLTSTESVTENLRAVEGFVAQAALEGAEFILTPEVTNCIAASRDVLSRELTTQTEDAFLKRAQELASEHGVWILLGSLGVVSETAQGKFANRSLLIDPNGAITASYDKIHMFDVDISETESYRESKTYEHGTEAVLAPADFAKIGMTICYDLRFPHLFRALAQAGAEIITVPAAFAQTTGEAHWHALLRARAIENGAYVLAPAQTGLHYTKNGKERRTYGHSLVVAPWGEVILDAGTEPGVYCIDIDLAEVGKARKRVGSLTQKSVFEGPV